MAQEQARVLDPEFVALARQFSAGAFTDEVGNAVHYRLFTPALAEGQRYPLVIFLHGSGERGSDNELQVAGNRGAVIWTRPEEQAVRPCYVLAPQADSDGSFTIPGFEQPFFRFLQQFCAENPVDSQRIYLTGLSMGGMGTWHWLSRYPRLFAAAAPICGAGDPEAIVQAKDVPVWAFHAVDDPFVDIERRGVGRDGAPSYGTRLMAAALRNAGGRIRTTEYPAGYIHAHYGYDPAFAGHAAWEPAYDDGEFRAWLFAQDRRTRDTARLVKPGVWAMDDYSGASYYLVEGKERALVIDTGMGDSAILPLLRTLTEKPLALAVTHAHGDHMRHADEFDRVYLPAAELPALERLRATWQPGLDLPTGKLCALADGARLELGGCEVELALCPGHTPGSAVYLDHGHRCVFCGDAFGSGLFVLMAVPLALTLGEYHASLQALAVRLRRCPDYAYFGGHAIQARGSFQDSPFLPPEARPQTYNPPRLQLVEDMAQLCARLLAGQTEGERADFGGSPEDPALLASFGSATILYRRSQLR